MARLQRQSAATPSNRNTPAPTSRVIANALQYKHPLHPLNPAAQRTLDNLQRAHNLNKLKEHYRRAAELVTDSASSINERHALKLERRAREQRRKRAKEAEKEKEKEEDGREGEESGQADADAEAEAEAEAEAAREIERLTDRVNSLTQRMDESIRRIVDGQVNVEAVEHCLRVVQNKAANAGGTAVAASQRREGRPQQQQRTEGDDEEMADAAVEDPSGDNALELIVPLETFRQELNRANERYKVLSMGARYSENNDYIGFRQSVHDAKHGDEGPPLAHASTWFSTAASGSQSGQGASTTSARTNARNGNLGNELDSNDAGASSPLQSSSSRRNGNQSATTKTASLGNNQRETDVEESAEEDDVAIARERISTRCPLTLREFDEPVTSRNCPHTFEKTAIFGLIDNAPSEATRRRGAPARNLAKQVKCPVTGCYEMLRAADLYTDPVLVRKIRRIQQSRIRAASEEEEDAEEDSANRNSLIIPSDLTEDIDADNHSRRTAANIKRENFKREETERVNETERGIASGELQGPTATQRSVIVDLENDTEEENDGEEGEDDEEDEDELHEDGDDDEEEGESDS